jgi:hypothetical protein
MSATKAEPPLRLARPPPRTAGLRRLREGSCRGVGGYRLANVPVGVPVGLDDRGRADGRDD